ncbi:MAG TPA: 30S ribosomal protein S6 [Ktedonobacterales bacterium]|jgi:small subunit ribosomal protein S6
MQRDYELGLIVNPDVGDDQTRAIVERVTHYVTSNDGTVVRVNPWGRRHMAYPIERHRDGLYYWFDLILPPTAVADLERSLRVNEDVIRHLLKSRDPRGVVQARQREAEAEAHAQARQREAEEHAAAVAAQRPAEAPVAEAPVAEAPVAEALASEPAAAAEPASAAPAAPAAAAAEGEAEVTTTVTEADA